MDSLIPARDTTTTIFDRRGAIKNYRPSVAGIVIPAAMVGYGFIALKSSMLQSLNHSTRAELREDHPTFSTKVDNYLKSAPALVTHGRKTLSGTTFGKHPTAIDSVEAGALDAALISLSIEQRIAVKAQLMRAGLLG